jgi:hypothetical protein
MHTCVFHGDTHLIGWVGEQVTKVRKMYERIIGDKHEDTLAKFGAILAQGVIDAGACRSR